MIQDFLELILSTINIKVLKSVTFCEQVDLLV